MNTTTREISELNVGVLRHNIGTGIHRLRFNGISVPVHYRRGTNDTMVILFHGAIDQHKRNTPWFQNHLPELDDCHQLSIADPTLELGKDIRSGWYLGGASMPLQTELPSLLHKLFQLANTEKRLYLGGSSGGFAALYYSFTDPGSVCIAVNPQTRLQHYKLRSKPVDVYVQRAWPQLKTISEVGSQSVIDLALAYGGGFDNLVIYLQSVGDLRHYKSQMPEFVRVGLKNPNRFILNSGYWGVPDHSNSIPTKNYCQWVKAVVTAPWFDRQAILDTHHILTTKAAQVVERSDIIKKGFIAEDFRFADLLRDYHLRQPTNE